jgi:hypothetical protein
MCIAVLQHEQFWAAVPMIVDRCTTQEFVYIFSAKKEERKNEGMKERLFTVSCSSPHQTFI